MQIIHFAVLLYLNSSHMTKLLPSVVAGFIKSCMKPVLLADSFCWFRYILLEQESRIRVSGTTTPLRRGLVGGGSYFKSKKSCVVPVLFNCAINGSNSVSRILVTRNIVNSLFSDIARRSAHLQVKITMPEKKHFERLPKSVIPKNYDLFLKPNLTKFTFEGKETIKITVSRNRPILGTMK